MTDIAAYWILLGSAFLSATLLPGSSEAVLVGFLATSSGQPATLVAVASIGNIAGAIVNWALGRFFAAYQDRAWFPVSAAAMGRAQGWLARFGLWSLLLSWVPVIGDPLTVVAGLLRVPFWRVFVLVSVGKVMRYGFVVYLWQRL